MYPDDCDTVEVYTASSLKNIIDSSLVGRSEVEVLKMKVDELKTKLAKLISILPPELKLAFELTDDVPEKSED